MAFEGFFVVTRACRRAPPLLAFVLALFAVANGCASTQKGDGSESHFVNCSSDDKCAELGLGKCVSGKCERAAATDGSVPSPDAFVCGEGLYPPCCGTSGQVPRICPDGAQAICPPGSYETLGSCPTECAVADPKLPVPYPMTFRFTNASGKKVAVWHGCIYEFELTACASGYGTPVQTTVICGAICPNTDQPTCGACYDEPAPVTAASPVEYDWDGNLYSKGSAGGRPCAAQTALPATKYRITVQVYPDAPPMLPTGGYEKVPLYSVSVDFTTSPNGVVEIPIDRGP